jgi:hypothetical protein
MATLHSGTDLWARCFFLMETLEQYRDYALICERLAKLVKNEHHKEVLEQMAREWRRLADEPS